MIGNFEVYEKEDGNIYLAYDAKVHYPHTPEGKLERIALSGTIPALCAHIKTKPMNQIYNFKLWARTTNNLIALVLVSTII